MARRTIAQLSASFEDKKTVSGSNFLDIFQSNLNLEETGTTIASGSLKLLGDITAIKYIISSSVTNKEILNVSGSTHFGDSMDDVHTRTGSMSITGSLNVLNDITASFFKGEGPQLTNLKRPITSSNIITGLTASADNAGYYFTVGGNIVCSIQANATIAVSTGTEYEFFQTSSAGNFSFLTGSGVTFYSKDAALTLTGQYSAASLKKIDTDTWTLVGDLA